MHSSVHYWVDRSGAKCAYGQTVNGSEPFRDAVNDGQNFFTPVTAVYGGHPLVQEFLTHGHLLA